MSEKNAIIMGSAITITIFHCSNYLSQVWEQAEPLLSPLTAHSSTHLALKTLLYLPCPQDPPALIQML